MTKEHEFVLRVLSDFLNQRPTTAPYQDLDFSEIRRICKDQQIEGILFYQLKNDTEQKKQLEAAFAGSVYNYTQRKTFYQKVKDEFGKSNIPFIIFKGLEIAELYPVPQLRTMGDVDFLVHSEDKQRAGEIWESLGLRNQNQGPNEWIYYQDGIEYELHSRMMNEEEANLPAHSEFMSHHWEYATVKQETSEYRLDWSFHFAFVLLHLRKHLINSGVGFRQFMDVAVIAQKCALNWEWIEQQLVRLDILPFAMNCFALCQRWFDVEMPMAAKIDDDFYEKATETVVNGGVFGFCDTENKDNYTKLLIKNKKNYRIKQFFSMLFPPYRVLKEIPEYRSLNGKPLLLPLFWIYRFYFCIVKGKAKSGLAATVQPFRISSREVELRDKELRQWGL